MVCRAEGLTLPEVHLSAGPIEYREVGQGPVILLFHDVLMDSALWEPVVAELAGDFRCILPTWPLGAHRRAMQPDADLSLAGHARLIAEFLYRLDLEEVTIVCTPGRRLSCSPPTTHRGSRRWCWWPWRPTTTTRRGCRGGSST